MDHLHLHLHLDGIDELCDTLRLSSERLSLFITQQGEALVEALETLTAEVAALRTDLHDREAALAAAVDANQPAA